MIKLLYIALATILLFSCNATTEQTHTSYPDIERPNIVWIVAEDLSEYIPSFGDSTITTPHISNLAAQGVCYDQFFTPAAVCAPARSAIATGLYPTHLGSNHMRTGPWYAPNVSEAVLERYQQFIPEGIVPYEAVPPVGVKMVSEHLRAAGYYCTNNSKEDYQWRRPLTAWDESSNKAHWKNRREDQPFFAVFNLGITHESQIWARAEDSLWVDTDLKVDVPPYLPDNEVGKTDVRRMYSNIKIMDNQVGKLINELDSAGLLESTIVMWYTDHGGPLPRQKRLLYDSGIKVPLVVKYPDNRLASTRNDDLVSFIDLAPTLMSLAGLVPPDQMDGHAFLGKYKSQEPAKYVFAAADRFDESYDKIRAVRDKRYKYIKYYSPEKPMFLNVNYRNQMPVMQELHRLRETGGLTPEQALWFRETKPEEEFFDLVTDPHELNNLAADPKYADKKNELRKALEDFQSAVPDLNMIDEQQHLVSIWPGKKQPTTATPEIDINNGTISIKCDTKGASIGYQIIDGEDTLSDNWKVFTGPFKVESQSHISVMAHRIGYRPSSVIRESLP